MTLEKMKQFKFNKAAAIILAAAVAFTGIGVMALTNQTVSGKTMKATEENTLLVPGAGMGGVLDGYVDATSGSSIELLSTTALGASLEGDFNEYYDANGSTIGKLIIYNGEGTADVYDKIKGNERIEKGAQAAKVVGHMYTGDVATLVKEQGNWYQIISDSVNGYVLKDGFVRGMEAEGLDGSTYISAAFANSDDVYLYEEDWDGSKVLCVLPSGVRYTLVEEGDELSKISVPGVGEGWVLNSDMTFAVVRKYAALVSAEIDNTNRINDGVAAAEEVEIAKEQQQALDTAVAAQRTINIAPGAPDSADTAALRQAIADYAQQFVGVLPYIWGSSDLSYGADCSGFTSAIYRAYGIEISRSAGDQAWGGTSVPIEDIRPGDIVAYSGHVALYIGDGTVVHESVPGTTASYASMYMMPIINVVRYIN